MHVGRLIANTDKFVEDNLSNEKVELWYSVAGNLYIPATYTLRCDLFHVLLFLPFLFGRKIFYYFFSFVNGVENGHVLVLQDGQELICLLGT